MYKGTCVSRSFGELATTQVHAPVPAVKKCGPRAARSSELLKEDALSDFFFLISNDLVFQCRLKLFLTAQPNKTLMQLLESAGGQFVSDGRHLYHIK